MRPATTIPEGITFNGQYRAIASSYGFSDDEAESEFEAFVGYHRDMESERPYWPTSWRAWLIEARRREIVETGKGGSHAVRKFLLPTPRRR